MLFCFNLCRFSSSWLVKMQKQKAAPCLSQKQFLTLDLSTASLLTWVTASPASVTGSVSSPHLLPFVSILWFIPASYIWLLSDLLSIKIDLKHDPLHYFIFVCIYYFQFSYLTLNIWPVLNQLTTASTTGTLILIECTDIFCDIIYPF